MKRLFIFSVRIQYIFIFSHAVECEMYKYIRITDLFKISLFSDYYYVLHKEIGEENACNWNEVMLFHAISIILSSAQWAQTVYSLRIERLAKTHLIHRTNNFMHSGGSFLNFTIAETQTRATVKTNSIPYTSTASKNRFLKKNVWCVSLPVAFKCMNK